MQITIIILHEEMHKAELTFLLTHTHTSEVSRK